MSFLTDLAGIGGALGSAYIGAEASKDAAQAQTAALNQGIAVSEAARAKGREDLMATAEPGLEDLISGFQGALTVLEDPGQAESNALALSGARGAGAEKSAIDSFVASPGQEWLRDQQEEALLRNEAAIGGLGGGNVRTALQDQAFGRAATEKQNRFNNLASLINPEQQRQTNMSNILSSGGQSLATFRGNLGSNLANAAMGGATEQLPLYAGKGLAEAGGVIGQTANYQQGLQNVGSTLGQLGY